MIVTRSSDEPVLAGMTMPAEELETVLQDYF